MSKTSLPLHPTRARINLHAFRHNLRVVRSYVGKKVKIMAVVKADAYGHGMQRIAAEAFQSGAEYLAVARVDEGLRLRMKGIRQPILVCEIVPKTFLKMAISNDLELTVSSVDGAKHMNAVAGKLGVKARVHVKVDTGMGRLGFPLHASAASLEQIARLRRLELVGIYSHFATSDEADQTYALEQLGRFTNLLEKVHKMKIEIPLKHMANSGAVITLPGSHFDMVRPGIMLYGYTPRKGMVTSKPLRPVMSLVSVVTLVKRMPKGTSISYGRRYFTKHDAWVAAVPLGYADGYSRKLTNNTNVLIGGKRYPVVGSICMDHVMVEIGRTDSVNVGDVVTFIGEDGNERITAWDIAEKLHTIPYEVICMVNARVPREQY